MTLKEDGAMAKLTLTLFLTLDGVVQAAGRADEGRRRGFEQGGWRFPYADDDMDAFLTGWFEAADGFLFGRRTFEIWAASWPGAPADDPMALRINNCPKYVVSTALTGTDWNNTTIIASDVVEKIVDLKSGAGNEVQVHGSGALARTLMTHDLVDEYRIWLHPVVLGSGHRLFENGVPPIALRLTDTKITGKGVAVHVYEPAGRPTYGSFQ
jgi:dihydrofolate reductase